MEYLMHHQHEPIMYPINNIFKLNDSPLQCFFNTDSVEMNQTQKIPTSFPKTVMQILQYISVTEALPPQHITSSMEP